MEAKHTAGPWFVRGTLIESARNTVAALSKSHLEINPEESEANARLISAAPDLLAALRAIVARINGVWDDPDLMVFGPLTTESADLEAIASQAIAKTKEA